MSVASGAIAGPRFALRSDLGHVLPLDVARWFGEVDPLEHTVLDRAEAPVLDVGCGPARHTRALLARGMAALGVDVSPVAVAVARARGAPVVWGSIFEPVPGEGAWATALLLDGNVGIGGDPVVLLRRLREVLRPGGRALVELDAPGTPTESFRARLGDDEGAPWFPWARVGADGVDAVAEEAGFVVRELWPGEGRWFGRLDA